MPGCRSAGSNRSLTAATLRFTTYIIDLRTSLNPTGPEDEEVFVWAAVDIDMFEVLHIDVLPGRSSLNALPFLKEVLN